MPPALTSTDRQSIVTLHFIPASMRDASGEGSSSRWRNSKPTIIEEPSNRRPSLNPFSGSRMMDNLNSGSNSRRFNPTANAVLRPHRDQPPKRKKIIGSTFPLDEPFRPPNISNQTKNKEKVLLASSPHIISDSEEDTGDVVPRPPMGSPDQLDTLSDSPKSQKGPNSKATSFKTLSKLPQPAKTSRQEAGSSRSSPIECYDDDVVEDRSRRSTGLVQQRVDDIEKKSIPQIDLSQHQRSSVKDRMKGRNMAKTFEDVIFAGPSAPVDPIATSSTPFHDSKGKAKENTSIPPEETICLPVEEWCLGKMHFLEPCTISFEPKGKHVKVIYEDVEEMFYFAHITSTTWSEPETFFCVSLSLKRPMRKQTIGSNYQDYFKPGEAGGKSDITFKFDSSDKSWSRGGWNAFIQRLQETGLSSRPLRGDETAKVVWRESCKRTSRNRGRPKPKIAHSIEDIEDQTSPYFRESSAKSSTSPRGPVNVNDTEASSQARPRLVTYGPAKSSTSSRGLENVNGTEVSSKAHLRPITYGSAGTKRRTSFDAVEDQSDGPRRSTRNNAGTKRKSPAADPEEVILSYPPNAPGAVNITNADLGRLEPHEYLNDTLIEFGLKLWHRELEEKNPQLAQQVHVFNSFFFKKLSKKNVEEGYQSVRRWTSKFDIFDKKYVIVPINENFHWYLAIIFQPGNVLLPPPEKEPPATRRRTRQSNGSKTGEGKPEDIPQDTENQAGSAASAKTEDGRDKDATLFDEADLNIAASATVVHDDHLDGDNLEEPVPDSPMVVDDDGNSSDSVSAQLTRGLSDVMDLDGQDDATMVDISGQNQVIEKAEGPISAENFYAKPTFRKGKEQASGPDNGAPAALESREQKSVASYPIPSLAYIIILDSLGNRHPKASGVLSHFMALEAKDKKGNENTSKPNTKYAMVPAQPNFSDCGLFLLHFARVFVEKTDYLMDIILRGGSRRNPERIADWDAEHVGSSRERLIERIEELSKIWKAERAVQLGEEEKKKKAKTDAEQPVQISDSSDSDVDIVESNTVSRASSVAAPKGGKGATKAKKSSSGGNRKPAARLRG
ncbi:sumo deconjugating cysteine peptidase ulp2 [Moniliophthora roreri]|nr:sumo deconjugating cysteine peptidase ulp2 [Moniliophthora roreri]